MAMRFVNVVTYSPKRGEVVKGKPLTQLSEYQPLSQQLANLSIAGLNAMAKQALAFYDSDKGPDDVDIPLLPRHISPDITEVQRVAEYFGHQKQLIEEKVRQKREERIEKLRAAQQAASNPPSGAPGSGGGVSAPVGGEPPK